MPNFSDDINNTNNEVNESKAVCPIRVVLIADYGEILTLLLPDTIEGRYRFADSFGLKKFPVFFEAEHDEWVVNLEKPAYFYKSSANGEKNLGQKHDLVMETMFRFKFKDEKYTIYSEEEHPGDHMFLSYYIEERTDYVIGRTNKCDICYQNFAVSREHARLHWDGNQWTIVDLKSTNGTYLNGKKIDKAILNVGDIIFIVGLYIIIGAGFISINNHNNRVSFGTPKIRHIVSQSDISYSLPTGKSNYTLYERAPRKMININPQPIEIEMPPMSLRGNNIPLLLRLGSPMLMGGQALMTGNILMAMTSMVIPTLTQGFTEKDRREYEAKRLESYRKYLVYIRESIENEKTLEEQQLNFNYPNLNNTLKLAITRKRLWDRRKSDSDFLKIRIGYGSFPILAEIKYPQKKFQIESDVLEDEMYEIAEKKVFLNNVPIMYSFVEDYITGIIGDHCAVMKMIKHMILQLVSTHSYDELKIVLIADSQDAKNLHFIRYLPHNWSNDKSIRFFITNQTEAQQLSNYLNKEREEQSSKSAKYNVANGVSYIVFALNKTLFNYIDSISKVLSCTSYEGMSVVVSFDVLPKECGKVIYLVNQPQIIDYFHPEKGNQQFSLDNCDNGLALKCIKKISETKINTESVSYMLPNMITFLEMYNVGKVEHLNPIERWESNDPVKSLAAPIGIGIDGKLFNLDLHEKFQGPHGLVAGMTGSGKSEFLITYILSMAVNYSPDEVAFVLIDYKGGGLADAFEDKNRGIHLPHLVGTITNLDGSSIQRSLMSIKSELKRRQTVFKMAKSKTNEGTMDIYDYQKLYRNNKVSEPMPHLFIISDEFAEMKAQQPEFMNELISTARIGRSLGVHLILATQKPSGVVNDQIRSNTKFQVCLRVQDRSDSMDMIKRPDAAELKNTGRFYLQVGYNELFAQGQSAWCGAEYTPQDTVEKVKDSSVQFIDNLGQSVLKVEPVVEKVKTGAKQVVAVVKHLSDLAKRENIVPKSLWLDPLPNKLNFDELLSEYKENTNGFMKIVLGLIDDPEQQTQFPFILDLMSFHHMLLCGNAASGKSTLIRTMLLQLIEKYSPEKFNYYILDLSDGALNAFNKLPHCSAYLNDSNEDDIGRLLDHIEEIVAERKELFLQADVMNYNAYCQINKLPMILVIMDGYTKIRNLRRGNDYFNILHEYLIDASNYGIKFIITCNHTNEISSKCKQEIDYRLSLSAKDRFEYGDILNVKVHFTPSEIKGRGMCVIKGRPLEYQVAVHNLTENEQNQSAILRKRLETAAMNYCDSKPARKLPMIEVGQTYANFCVPISKGCMPLGYSTKDMRQITMPFQQLYSLSIYFGNPIGVKPVLDNLIEVGRLNNMDIVILRRIEDTIFNINYASEISKNYPCRITFLDVSEDGLKELDNLFVEEIKSRNVWRDEYCRINGIPETDKNRAKQASRYIRKRTKPLFVIFESFGDLCRQPKDENMDIELCTFLSKTKGYNIYFAGCFYPNEEGNISNNSLMKCFNKEEVFMLFGGQYDKQSVTNSLPMEYRRIEQINPKYDRYLLKYRGEYHTLLMPCGELSDGVSDPDEVAII